MKIEIALDIAWQCSPDHPWVREHPEWFKKRPDGSIQYAENPPKKYQDIYPINFESDDWQGLWHELKSVIDFWIDQGVTVFRVDNPHTKALAVLGMDDWQSQGRAPGSDLSVRGFHAAQADLCGWPSSGSRNHTTISPGAIPSMS